MITTLLFLHIFGWIYATAVRRLRHRNPDGHGQTAWLVVVGVAVVIAAYTWITSINAGALLLAAFAAAGIPMVVEYVDDYTNQRRAKRMARFLETLDNPWGEEDD